MKFKMYRVVNEDFIKINFCSTDAPMGELPLHVFYGCGGKKKKKKIGLFMLHPAK